ncbi:MAG: formyltransferase family protein [Patescibacteria group bacterium]|nr:formyltransferase family protein [Patescibacteria group bacterium]
MSKPKILVFASGDKVGGGSGFQELVENSRTGVLDAEIIGVISNHKDGGVKKRAIRLGISFHHMTEFGEQNYRLAAQNLGAEWICLSGWLKFIRGLNPAKTINIHPGLLPLFGGRGMYGHHVHEAVIKAFKKGEINETAVTMHFVDNQYDHGPIFFHYPVLIRQDDTADSLGERVNKIEHGWQSYITNLVVHGSIRLEGGRVIVPTNYPWRP